jgi:hypothetical protein
VTTATATGHATLETALKYLQAGLSVIPIRPDGSKQPALPEWGPFKADLPSERLAHSWWEDGSKGIAILGGKVSGNLDCIDFDRDGLFASWRELVEEWMPGLIDRLCLVRTPRGPNCYHVWYRCCEVQIPGNTKLAQEPSTDPETGKPCRITLIETRGEGGYALAPGSPPACHETGRTYEHVGGPPLTDLPEITAQERELLLTAARSFDLAGAAKDQQTTNSFKGKADDQCFGDDLRPGDDYNQRGPDWAEILGPHGWERGRNRGETIYWRRPGKDTPGYSATTGYCHGKDGADLLAVFSSNAYPFEGPNGTSSCTCYSKFRAYAILNHNGDLKAAARELGHQGYGDQNHHSNGKSRDLPLPTDPPWPGPLAPEAFHGLAGEIVRVLEPASEADPAALLFQLLVAFGNVIGRNGHFVVEADQHFCNEFVVLVGRTAKGRKGTSFGQINRLLDFADQQWVSDRVQTGLSSGEGLIWAVRDPIVTRQAVKEKGRVTGHQEVETDPGIADKRLLVVEPEFASVLKQTERQGNVLSAVVRQAWETGNLRTMTKNNPARATGAHISLIGHCTCEELRRYLSVTEMANGFGNRFLWACVQRSKVLPEGGLPDANALAALKQRLANTITFARRARVVERDEKARGIWHEVYGQLSEGKTGLAGALLARAEAHVMRLAMIYALMDQSAVIKKPHLLAALALWVYVENSVHHVFGDSLGDPVADDLLRLLRASPAGLTRNDLMNYFGRHLSSGRIGQALGLLLQQGLVRCEQQQTGGRPAEKWFATSGQS